MRPVILILPLFFLFLGCSQKIDLGPGYAKTSNEFLRVLRWQEYGAASVFLREDIRQEFIDRFEALDDVYFVDAVYRRTELNAKAGTASAELVIDYYQLPSTRVRQWHWQLDWVLLPVDTSQPGTWQLVSPPPAFP